MIVCKSVDEFIDKLDAGARMVDLTFDNEDMYTDLMEYCKNSENPRHRYTTLGVCYEIGLSVEKDYKLAFELFSKGAELNEPKSITHLGYMYFSGRYVDQNREKACELYKRGTELDEVGSIFNLGVAYKTARGVEEDLEKAFNLFLRAAEKNHKNAQFNLALAYFNGIGCTKDVKKAIKYFTITANDGNVDAEYNLGRIYYYGIGIEKNPDLGKDWFEKAANHGSALAQKKLSGIYLHDGKNIKKSNKTGRTRRNPIYRNPYSSNLETDFFGGRMGMGVIDKACYDIPYGNDKSDDELKNRDDFYRDAFKYCKMAADQGDPGAINSLADFYFYGNGVEMDYLRAFELYEKSAKKGCIEAQYNVAYCYYSGKGIEKNLNIALKYCELSIDGGYNLSKELLVKINSELVNEKKDKDLHLGPRKDVFISWNHADLDFKNRISEYLESNGLCSVWESDGDGNGPLYKAISDAIHNAKAFLVILSHNSIESKWVMKEVDMINYLIKADQNVRNRVVIVMLNEEGRDKSVHQRINEFDDFNPFKMLINDQIFTYTKDVSEKDLFNLKKKLVDAIERAIKLEYKEKVKNKFEKFTSNLSIDMKSDSDFMNTVLDFNSCYIDRKIYYNDKPVDKEVLLDKEISLICADGGMGKTMYLINLLKNEFNDNKFIFYATCKDLETAFHNSHDLGMSFKKACFDILFPNDYKISLKSFEDLFNVDNNIYILIDALDEVPRDIREKIYTLTKELKYKYKNIRCIFTSRNTHHYQELVSSFNMEASLFKLYGFTNREMEDMFDNINENYIKNSSKNGASDENDAFKISKPAFFNSLDIISDDIKKNPFLLSSLLYIYICNHEMPSKKYDILNKSNEILIDEIEKENRKDFNYYSYIVGNKLTKLLGCLAVKRAMGRNWTTEKIITNFLKKNEKNKNDDMEVVGNAICEYLRGRKIIDNDNINYEIFRDYYASCYLFQTLFEYYDEDDDGIVSDGYYYKDGTGEKFKGWFSGQFNNDELPWPSIVCDLITKLDFEINSLRKNQTMNKRNPNYRLFNDVLLKGLKNAEGFSELAKETIKGLCDKELLYFNEFIKGYFNR